MRGIRRRLAQNRFGVRGQFNFPYAPALIGQRQVPYFGIVFARYQNLHDTADRPVLTADLRAIFEEGHSIIFRFAADRLVSGGPYAAVEDIAQEQVVAPMIAGGILAPA